MLSGETGQGNRACCARMAGYNATPLAGESLRSCGCGGTGRRAGLKIQFWQQSVGSIPTTRTTERQKKTPAARAGALKYPPPGVRDPARTAFPKGSAGQRSLRLPSMGKPHTAPALGKEFEPRTASTAGCFAVRPGASGLYLTRSGAKLRNSVGCSGGVQTQTGTEAYGLVHMPRNLLPGLIDLKRGCARICAV